jgi:hypothetical protein
LKTITATISGGGESSAMGQGREADTRVQAHARAQGRKNDPSSDNVFRLS